MEITGFTVRARPDKINFRPVVVYLVSFDTVADKRQYFQCHSLEQAKAIIDQLDPTKAQPRWYRDETEGLAEFNVPLDRVG